MRELAKSMISFSWAMGLAGAKGLLTLSNGDQRKHFCAEAERSLRHGTDATLDILGRELRETFTFADDFQRHTIDAFFDTAAMASSKVKSGKKGNPPRSANE